MTIYVGTIVLVSWEGDEGGGGKLVEYEMGFRNWRRSGGLNKGGGMSQEERQGRVQRGGGLHAVGDQQRATTKTCCNAWTGSQLKKSFRARQQVDRVETQRGSLHAP